LLLFHVFFVDCNTTTTATNSWGQKLHVIQSEKQQSDRRCTKQVASWKSNFGSEFTEKFEGDSIDVLHVLPAVENFPPPHGWRKVGGRRGLAGVNQQDGMSMLFQQRK